MKLVLMSGAVFISIGIAACATSPTIEKRSALEHGRDLFEDPAASGSSLGRFSCATCHPMTAADRDDRILPGAVLAGAVARPTFWGGQVNGLLQAINHCRYYFMAAPRAWTPEDDEAKAMYGWLRSLPPDAPTAQPFTVVPIATDLPPGDREAGRVVYERACKSCHGAPHTGEGRLPGGIPKLPEESVTVFEGYEFSPTEVRVTFIEKVRHGAFLGLYGNMPPYSTEVLSDDELSALLAFFDLYP